ncbi:MAG: acyltransferase [Tatlockia sp.]|nr:acyltransferase [Tatlockia sp.]
MHNRPPTTNASCAATCVNRLTTCTKVCRNDCPQCIVASNKKTARNYDKYVREQCIKGQIIALQLNSFRDPLQCRKITCNCPADYEVCLQSCGGPVIQRLQHVPLSSSTL